MIRDRRIAFAYRAASFAIALVGFLMMLGVFHGGYSSEILTSYTMQSNILAIVLFGLLTVRTAKDMRETRVGNTGHYTRLVMVVTINLTLTFIVYWVLLAGRLTVLLEGYSLWTFENLAVHGITPLLCLVDYILFSKPRQAKYRDVYYACIFPAAYLAVTSLAGFMGHVYYYSFVDGGPVRFPYFFYDFDRIGSAALAYIGAMCVFILLVGHAFYLVDKKIRK